MIRLRQYAAASGVWAILVLSACGGPSVYTPPVPERLPEERLQTVLQEYVAGHPGVLGSVQRIDLGGYQTWEATSGFFDAGRERRLGIDDHFLIGRITETFTAAVIARLEEQERIYLDGPVTSYLPTVEAAMLEHIPHGRQITVRQLLGHRSGLYSYAALPEYTEAVYAEPGRSWSALDLLAIVLSYGQPSFAPGEAYEYSSTNYLLLGLLVERLTGVGYATAVQALVLDRLVLGNTWLPNTEPPGARPDDRYQYLAHAYESRSGGVYDALGFHPMSLGWAGGGAASRALDLGVFLRGVVSEELFDGPGPFEALSALGRGSSYGLGLAVRTDARLGTGFGNTGNAFGYGSYVWYFPDVELVVSGCLTGNGAAVLPDPDELLEQLVAELPVDAD